MSNTEIMSFCRAYMRACPSVSIRPSQMQVLEILCTVPGPHTPMMLADCLRVSRPMVAAHLVALQDAGYISRVASTDDGRSVFILPTKKAQNLVNKHNRELSEFNAKIMDKVGRKKYDAFVAMIKNINAMLTE